MKRLMLIIICLCITMLIQAQVYKTVNATAGGLATALTPAERSTVTNLTLTGTIDARDFRTMRDSMAVLSTLDLGTVTIVAFRGILVTYYDDLSNTIPVEAFKTKKSLKSIILPSSVTAIATRAFLDCTGLTSFTIPKTITSIAVQAFNGCSSLSSIYVYGPIPIVLSSSNYVFYDVNPNSCILHVPYGSTALYAAAIQWNSFKNIVEMPGFGLSTYNISLAATSTTASVTVVSNITWTVSCNDSWLTVSPSSSTGNNTLILTVQANPSVATRTALITISSPGIVSQILNVTQIGLPKSLELTAGGLSSALTAEELNTTTKLILTGTIDARDFKTMRDLMPVLAELDLSGATIAAYYGLEGPVNNSNYKYLENSIPEGAFNGKRRLKSAILPLSLTAIQNYAFSNCSGLTSVTAPSSVTLIDQYAFSNCSGLTSFDMPSSVTTFGRAAFENCSLLTSITIPSSVTYIGDNAFSGCNSLTSIYAYGVTPVYRADDWYIFTVSNISCKLYVPYGTSALYAAVSPWKYYTNMVEMPGFNLSSYKVSFPTSESAAKVAINANVTWTATSDASWLTVNPASFNGNDSITISAQTNPSIAARTALVNISAAGVVPQVLTVMQVGNLKTLQVTAGGLYAALTPIERQTIYNLRLTGTIDASDFKTMRDRMPSLTQLDISGTSIAPYSGSDGTFNSNHDYPANTVPIYAFLNPYTQLGKTSLISVALPSSSTTIDGWAFYGCTGLTNITLPSLLSIIGSNAFQSCTGLNSLALPPSLINIGSNAFQNCTGLTSFTIPPSVTTIESNTFNSCTGLISITIPSTLTYIGQNAFQGCTRLTTFAIPPSVTAIKSNTFNGCTRLSSITIPSTITDIGDGAFNGCVGLASITLPHTITSIHDEVFQGCSGLNSIAIPSTVISIGGNAFSHCTGLTSLTIPSSVATISMDAFSGCTGLTSLTIPSSVTYIGMDALSECTGLTSLTIPSSVTYIDSWAFFYCISLTSIYTLRVTPLNLSSSNDVFSFVNKTTCILHVPYGSAALYKAADQWKDFLNIIEMPGAGSIAANQIVCLGMIPAPLTSTVAGAGQGIISYRWEYSNNGISWLTTGTSDESYTPNTLTQTTMFRRITISTLNGINSESTPTEPVTISVTLNNTITLSSGAGTDTQTLCANSAITNITYTTTGTTGATFNGLPDGVTGAWNSDMVTISGIPSTSGTFNYTVTLTSCGMTTITGSIIVNAFPPKVSIRASQNNVYTGTPVTFTAIPVGGGTTPTYKWFLNNVAVASGPDGTYAPKNGDLVYAQMTSSLACSAGTIATSNTITMAVINPPAGTVSINVSQNNVCKGAPVTFTATHVGGTESPAYIWYLNNVAVTSGESASYIPTNGDEVYVVMTSCYPIATSNMVKMVVDPNSVGVPAQPAYFIEGKAYVTPGLSNVRYSVPNVADVTYIWSYSGTGATITGTSNSVLISFSSTATSGTLSVRASNSCGTSDPRSGNITVGNTLKAGIISDSVEQGTIEAPSAMNEIKVFPNPASGPVTFEFQINQDAKAILDLLSITGQRIARIFDADAQAGITHTVIYSEGIPAGVYIYTLKWKDQTITGKLIITK